MLAGAAALASRLLCAKDNDQMELHPLNYFKCHYTFIPFGKFLTEKKFE